MVSHKTSQSLRRILYVGIIFWSITGLAMASPESPDLSTPEKGFLYLQKSLNEKDASAIEKALADIPKTIPKQEIAESYVKAVSMMENFSKEEVIFLLLLLKGHVIRVEQLDTTHCKEWASGGRCRLWLRYEGNCRGCVEFIKQDGKWKWMYLFESPPVIDDYDLSTPVKAFQSLSRAWNVSEIWAFRCQYDIPGIFEMIASEVKDNKLSLEEYSKSFEKRIEQGGWVEPTTYHLSEEYDDSRDVKVEFKVEAMTKSESGKARCKVRKLVNGEEEGFEIFIQEGSEWKWLSAPDCVGYPPKP